jgi:hypothetical protein
MDEMRMSENRTSKKCEQKGKLHTALPESKELALPVRGLGASEERKIRTGSQIRWSLT